MEFKNIEDIDINFAHKPIGSENGFAYYDVRKEPFDLYGFVESDKDDAFHRMPPDIAKEINPALMTGCYHTAGGRVRFRTDSLTVIIRYETRSVTDMGHMPRTGSSFFDITVDGVGLYSMIPDRSKEPLFTSRINISHEKKMRDIELDFPLYNDVLWLQVAVENEAALEAGAKYAIEKPVVFYGSSITQGGCASRPSNSYEAILSHRYDFNYTNLGFSGLARAEDRMIDYLASLDMSVFVLDYDHNAPTIDHLKATHEKLFKAVRAAHPDMPIIMVSSPGRDSYGAAAPARRDIIMRTYLNAVEGGDKAVFFVDGYTMFDEIGPDLCYVDGCHPNDIGFLCMANKIGPVLENAFRLL